MLLLLYGGGMEVLVAGEMNLPVFHFPGAPPCTRPGFRQIFSWELPNGDGRRTLSIPAGAPYLKC